MVHVTANSKAETEALAGEKFRNLGIEPEYVNCKIGA